MLVSDGPELLEISARPQAVPSLVLHDLSHISSDGDDPVVL